VYFEHIRFLSKRHFEKSYQTKTFES